MVERTDVAYVGQIRGQFLPMIQIDASNYENVYFLPIYDTTDPSFIASAGSFVDALDSDNDVPLMVFQAEFTDGDWYFHAYNSAGTSVGYLTINTNGYLALRDTGAPFRVTTSDPAGYGSGLLTSVRYTLTTGSSDPMVNITSTAQIASTTPGTGGLFQDTGLATTRLSSLTWTFMPVTMASYLTEPPSQIGTLPPTARITQCVLQSGTGYGTSSNCTNWQNNRGFSTSADTRDIIYFYSESAGDAEGISDSQRSAGAGGPVTSGNNGGTCGQDYIFNNDYLGNSVSVTSSMGNCDGGLSCVYNSDDKIFSCGTEDGEDSLLNWRVIIMIVIAVIFIIILFAIIIGGLAYYNSQKKKKAAANQMISPANPSNLPNSNGATVITV